MDGTKLDQKPERNKDIVFQSMPPDTVLLDLESGFYYSTNTLGTEIWNRCDGQTSVRQIIDDLHQQFDIGLEALTEDVVDFVHQMVSESLLKVDPRA